MYADTAQTFATTFAALVRLPKPARFVPAAHPNDAIPEDTAWKLLRVTTSHTIAGGGSVGCAYRVSSKLAQAGTVLISKPAEQGST